MKHGYARAKQRHLPFIGLPIDSNSLANGSTQGRGAVFTRREVVDFILDLVGYTADKPLFQYRLLEPSFGGGDFIVAVVERLLSAFNRHADKRAQNMDLLCNALRAVEIHPGSIRETSEKIRNLLLKKEIVDADARRLLKAWIIEDDFLIADLNHSFTHIVGNPPYVRQELVPETLMAEYRARYKTIYDRADLYIPFIERCLDCLNHGGVLGFICADRWMKNKYGGPLREMVARDFHLQFYVDMVDTPAFLEEVSAYPAITIIRRERPGPTRVAYRPEIEQSFLKNLSQTMKAKSVRPESGVTEIPTVIRGRNPWILEATAQLSLVRRLEAQFPAIEDTGCRVGIGVATGADRVFIGPFEELDVETDRKLPLVKTRDIESGKVEWKGLGVVNPFTDGGKLVDLSEYPKLACYFERYADIVRKRNCAKKNPKNWYRTIDRIYPALAQRQKLLIPDIKGSAHIVYEEGKYYPHHNLYFITAEQWDLRALQTVLQAGIAKLFVSLYSTQLRGGYLRFQAQYIRRIRVPYWEDVPQTIRNDLIRSLSAGDDITIRKAVAALYGLTEEEQTIVFSTNPGINS